MSSMASKFTGVSIVCSTVCSGADQRKHQSSAPFALVRWIHRWQMLWKLLWRFHYFLYFTLWDIPGNTWTRDWLTGCLTINNWWNEAMNWYQVIQTIFEGWFVNSEGQSWANRRVKGCLLSVNHLIDILLQLLQLFMQYHTIMDRVQTAQDVEYCDKTQLYPGCEYYGENVCTLVAGGLFEPVFFLWVLCSGRLFHILPNVTCPLPSDLIPSSNGRA